MTVPVTRDPVIQLLPISQSSVISAAGAQNPCGAEKRMEGNQITDSVPVYR